MFTAKKRQKSVLELYLGNRFLMVSYTQPGERSLSTIEGCDAVPNGALGMAVSMWNIMGLPAWQSHHLLSWQQPADCTRGTRLPMSLIAQLRAMPGLIEESAELKPA